MPRARNHNEFDSKTAQLFWGRFNIDQGSSLFYYNKHSKYKQLLYKLKYKGRTDIGLYLGELLAHELMDTGFLTNIDALIPVPLHVKRKRSRGYNQSEIICRGISKVSGIKIYPNLILRVKNTTTQTNKTKEERIKNVENIFKVIDSHIQSNSHILLIDDVITTGATIESLAEEIQKYGVKKVSVAAIAIANDN